MLHEEQRGWEARGVRVEHSGEPCCQPEGPSILLRPLTAVDVTCFGHRPAH